MLTVEGDRTMELLLDSDFLELSAAISSDGRWMAYASNESGRFEIYVRPFPDVEAGKWQVSNDGGTDPVWSPDGEELFFGGDGLFMVAQVETEPTFSWTTPERLFDLGPFQNNPGREWDIAPDGDRFLFPMRSPMRGATAQGDFDAGFNGVIFVQNWFEELQARVPTGR